MGKVHSRVVIMPKPGVYSMYKRITYCFFILAALTASAQTINLRGIVSNSNGQPISAATVTLQAEGLSDITGTDGAYAIIQNIIAVSPSSEIKDGKISLSKGVLEFNLTNPAPVKIEIFDINGNLLVNDLTPKVLPGSYRSSLLKSIDATRPHMVRVSVGEYMKTFRYIPLTNGVHGKMELSGESALSLDRTLTKRAADVDSLKVTAAGYETKIVPISSYDEEVDITLQSSGNSTGRSAGCGESPTLTSGKRNIQVGGDNRSFILRLPENYDSNTPHRLVFAFHWNGGVSEDIDGGGSSGYTWSYYGLREQSDDDDLPTIYVAPQGINNGWQNSGGRDLNFVDDMLELIQEDLCIDTKRIFSMGFSYGGGMTYALACDRADIFRAVAVYGGAVLSGCTDGTKPVAYLGIHGIDDRTCVIENARPMRDKFVNNNGCTSQNASEPNRGSLTHVCTEYDGCTDGYPVVWCAFDGGHTPGIVDGGGDDGARTWTKGEAYKFFKQF